MGYVKAWVKFTIKVDDLEPSTKIRTVDSVIRPAIEDPRVKGFEVSKTEKVGFFRGGRYEK